MGQTFTLGQSILKSIYDDAWINYFLISYGLICLKLSNQLYCHLQVVWNQSSILSSKNELYLVKYELYLLSLQNFGMFLF